MRFLLVPDLLFCEGLALDESYYCWPDPHNVQAKACSVPTLIICAKSRLQFCARLGPKQSVFG